MFRTISFVVNVIATVFLMNEYKMKWYVTVATVGIIAVANYLHGKTDKP